MDRTNSKRQQVLNALDDCQWTTDPGRLSAGQVMTTTLSCVESEENALELVKLFHRKRFRHLLVTDSANRLVGVISDRDVVRCFGPDRNPDRSVLEKIVARQIMSTDLVTICPNTPLDRAASLMVEEGISCLPVLEDGTLMGIITNTDLHVVLQVLLQTLRQSSPEQSTAATISNPQN